MAVSVRGIDEADGNDVMGEHLPVILSALLDVDDQDLLKPEGKLRKHVSLHDAGELAVGPVRPKLAEVEEVR